jgi:hypothetical protein
MNEKTPRRSRGFRASQQAQKLATIASNMLQERGDELHGPIKPN